MDNQLRIVKPLVTVITVTYNSSAYVRDAIESVLAQTYSNIEYIIGDDCSTDNTWKIILEYKDPRIKAYRNEKNLKEYQNRNKAISMATGKYLIFIDGDDVIYDYGIKYFVDQVEPFPEAKMTIQRGFYNNVILPILLSPDEAVLNYYLGEDNFIAGSFSSTFFCRETLQNDGGLSVAYISGDEEIRLRLASKFETLIINGFVTWARETPGSASSRIRPHVALNEAYKMTHNLIKNCKGSILKENTGISNIALVSISKRLLKVIVRSFLSLNFSACYYLIGNTETSIIVFLRWALKRNKVQDPFKKYTPSNPYKMKIPKVEIYSF